MNKTDEAVDKVSTAIAVVVYVLAPFGIWKIYELMEVAWNSM